MASKRQRSPPGGLSDTNSLPSSKKGKTCEVSSIPSTSSSPIGAHLAPMPSHSVLRSAPTFFPNAREFQLDRLEYTHTAHHHYPPKQADLEVGWNRLLERSAPNALYDSAARFDSPKCDEDTRIEVTNEIMEWIQERDARTQLLCMTGAAGSGKSALQQTVSELCASRGILASSFFFNANDSTRNNVSGIVPTIAYQLGQKKFGLRQLIGAAVEGDPFIFDKALKTQMELLIVDPVHRFLANQTPNSDPFSYALLIDGLDECTEEDRQRELLVAIQECLLYGRTPFRIFLASRPELAIHEALHEGGHLHNAAYHIRLSDEYDASGDIRRSVQRRFHELTLLRKLSKGWFRDSDVEAIVEAASGQYVYAATVTRYISEPRGSPAERLRAVLTWTPGKGQKAKPFASLDVLYRTIILKAQQAFEEVDEDGRDFLLLLNCLIWFNTKADLAHQEKIYQLESGGSKIIFCDLRSILHITNNNLTIYHKSFLDFLKDNDRAGAVYVCGHRIAEHFSKCCLDRITEFSVDGIDDFCGRAIPDVPNSVEDWNYHYTLKRRLHFFQVCANLLVEQDPSTFPDDSFAEMVVAFIKNEGLEKIDKWYRAPEYGIEDWIRLSLSRDFFFSNWRMNYWSWLVGRLQGIAPELTSVVRKYDLLWNVMSLHVQRAMGPSDNGTMVPDVGYFH